MLKETELKPCPFCGDKVRFIVNCYDQWSVYCPNCKARAWMGDTDNKQIIAKRWNRRADNEQREITDKR